MAPLTQQEKDDLIARVSQGLSDTPYEASSLSVLTNGTTNFVFRNILAKPLQKDGREITSVIVKHSTEYAASNKDLPIDLSRAFQEEAILAALNKFRPDTTAQAPRLLHFVRTPSIQILEDFPSAVDLKGIFVAPDANARLTPPVSESIGRNLGAWLRSYHDWSFAPDPSLKDVGPNEEMRKLKLQFSYDKFLSILENDFLSLIEDYRPALEQVQDTGKKEFENSCLEGRKAGDWGLIHGDFWTGNILLPSDPSAGSQLFIVDWEFAQFGHRAYDIGQLIGDLYERKHFCKAEGATSAIEGFIQGYGQFDDELAFRTAIYSGVHLIGWFTRRAPNTPLGFPLEVVTEAMRIGRDWIVNGGQRNKDYFATSPLASLFKYT